MTLKDADKIKEAIKNSDDFVGGSDDIIKVIDSVPEVVISTDTDTISRKAAIEAVEFGITYAKAINKETGEVTALFEESNAELQEAADRIKQLPPTQPAQKKRNGKADNKYYTAVRPIAELEELNSDYINEHYGELQDEAYQAGLNDAWEAARKIVHMPEGDLLNIFTECYSAVCTALQVLLKYDASEAIDKLKAYEDSKPSDRIEVGDEVTHKSDLAVWKAVCIRIDGDRQHMNLMGHTGAVGYYPVDDFKKTGKHYDIASILEAMRE